MSRHFVGSQGQVCTVQHEKRSDDKGRKIKNTKTKEAHRPALLGLAAASDQCNTRSQSKQKKMRGQARIRRAALPHETQKSPPDLSSQSTLK
eukprot:6288808-Amphidinium_carterae.1